MTNIMDKAAAASHSRPQQHADATKAATVRNFPYFFRRTGGARNRQFRSIEEIGYCR